MKSAPNKDNDNLYACAALHYGANNVADVVFTAVQTEIDALELCGGLSNATRVALWNVTTAARQAAHRIVLPEHRSITHD
jgi:hypothetical protein